jgi:transcriptional regulator with XRE-family HTH domain
MCVLHERIDQLCKEQNLNFTALAEGAGVSRSVLSDLKSGYHKTLSSKNLTKIANYFNVSTDYLLGETNIRNPLGEVTKEEAELQEYLEVLKNRTDMRMLFQLAKNATKEDVEQAVRIIEALRK